MQYKRFGDTYAVRLDLDDEIGESLKMLADHENIQLGHVSAIGATDHAVIGVYNLESRTYHKEEVNAFAEITSLSGNLTVMDDKSYVHLHATLADQGNDRTIAQRSYEAGGLRRVLHFVQIYKERAEFSERQSTYQRD